MDWAGIVLDEARNQSARGEARISTDGSTTQIWVVPTNEEIVVARQSAQAIGGR
jgi:acetate kinase